MTARARKKDEDFDTYRKNLKDEAALLKVKLGGTILWNSSKDGTVYAVETERGKGYTDKNPKLP